MKKKMASKSGAGSVVAIGAGVAALAAASYYLFGPKGSKHRAQLKGWSIKMKGDVVEAIEKLKSVSEPVYNEIVDTIAAEYTKKYGSSKKEIAALAGELKKTWRPILVSTGSAVKKGMSASKKAVVKASTHKKGKKR